MNRTLVAMALIAGLAGNLWAWEPNLDEKILTQYLVNLQRKNGTLTASHAVEIKAPKPSKLSVLCALDVFIPREGSTTPYSVRKGAIGTEKRLKELEDASSSNLRQWVLHMNRTKTRVAALEKENKDTDRCLAAWLLLMMSSVIIPTVFYPFLKVLWPHLQGWLDRKCERVFSK